LPPVESLPLVLQSSVSTSPTRKAPRGAAVPAPKFLEAGKAGRDSPVEVDSLRSTSVESPATASTAPSAADAALLEAEEELKVSKVELEVSKAELEASKAQLEVSKAQLEAQLREANDRAEALELEAEEAAAAAVAATKAARLEREAQAEAAKHVEEAKEELNAAKEGLSEAKEVLGEENEKLRRERAELQQQLDVFFKAMELDKSEAPEEPADSSQKADQVAGLGQKIENLHSQLVLESVSLRSEVAKMKKKKWVLQAVLDNGGANEGKAINEEIEQLRRRKAET